MRSYASCREYALMEMSGGANVLTSRLATKRVNT